MRLELVTLLHCVLVIDKEAYVNACSDEPLLARNNFGATDGYAGYFKGLNAATDLVFLEMTTFPL